jgi:hypothetical protein
VVVFWSARALSAASGDEAETTAFLGRALYRLGERLRVGWRNGYEPKRVQSEGGVLELAVPQLRAPTNRLG